MSLLAKGVDAILAILLSEQQRERLGRHILNVVRGEGNSDPTSNGEYALLDSLKGGWRANQRTPVIFDVGANVGDWASKALEGLPPGSELYAFEPNEEAFRVLASNPNVRAMNFALGKDEGRVPFYVSESSAVAETNSIHKRRAEAFGLKQSLGAEVEVKRGDAVAHSLGIKRIDLVKIDTEGHELAVLQGFDQMLKRQQIDYIQFEYGTTWADSRTLLMDAFDLLTPLGYRLGKIHPVGVQFFPEYHQGQETFTFANYLAVRQGLELLIDSRERTSIIRTRSPMRSLSK